MSDPSEKSGKKDSQCPPHEPHIRLDAPFPSEKIYTVVVQRVVVGFWRIYKTGKKERNSMLKTQKPAIFKFVHSKVKWEVFHR